MQHRRNLKQVQGNKRDKGGKQTQRFCLNGYIKTIRRYDPYAPFSLKIYSGHHPGLRFEQNSG